jgi:hypothetical protein
LVIFLCVVILLPNLFKSIKADSLFSTLDTRVEAARWINKNIAPLSKIAVDNTFFRPQIKQSIEQFKAKEAILDTQPELKGLKSRKLQLQLKTFKEDITYEIYFLVDDAKMPGQFLSFWPVLPGDLDEVKRAGIDYLVFDNMTSSPKIRSLRLQAANLFTPVAVFNPYYSAKYRVPYDLTETTGLAVASDELFSRRKPGPYFIIYRTK